jgi:hypothetical protein
MVSLFNLISFNLISFELILFNPYEWSRPHEMELARSVPPLPADTSLLNRISLPTLPQILQRYDPVRRKKGCVVRRASMLSQSAD